MRPDVRRSQDPPLRPYWRLSRSWRICNPSSCFDDAGTNFRRLCWPPWGVDLNCQDEEGVTHTVLIQNRSAAGGVLKGNPWW